MNAAVKDAKNVEPGGIAVPAELGSIQEIYRGNSSQTLILLQDAHAVPSAQASISRLLRYFSSRYGLRSVAVEGASGGMDTTLLRHFPDRERLTRVLESYREGGEISGAVDAAILDEQPVEYYGVEEPDIYTSELESFVNASKVKDEILSGLDRDISALESEKQKYYSAQLLQAEESLRQLEAQEAGLGEVLESFLNVLAPDRYPAIRAIAGDIDNLKKIQGPSLRREISALAEKAGDALSGADLADWAGEKQAFETQALDEIAFAAYLLGIVEERNLRLEVSGTIREAVKNREALSRLKTAAFARQWEAYSQEILRSLAHTREARSVHRQSRQLALARKLAELKLSVSEWQGLRKARPKWFESWPSEAHRRFYDLALQRDEIFFEKLKALMEGQGDRCFLFLAGGFHTQGVAERLRESRISYVVVSPAMAAHEKADRYGALMRGDVSWAKYFEARGGKINLHEAFLRGVMEGILAGTSPYKGLKLWRDEVVRDLASKGRAGHSGRYTRWIDEAFGRKMKSPEFAGLRARWKNKIENFAAGLRELGNSKPLTAQTLAELFSRPAAAPATDKAGLFPSSSVPEGLYPPMRVRRDIPIRADSHLSGPIERGRREDGMSHAKEVEPQGAKARPTHASEAVPRRGTANVGEARFPAFTGKPRSEMRSDESATAPLEPWQTELQEFKDQGVPRGQAAAYWASRSREMKRQLVLDLAAAETPRRRSEVNDDLNRKMGTKIHRHLELVVSPHQLRWEDFTKEVYPESYPGRTLSSFFDYYRELWTAAKQQQGYSGELLDFILADLLTPDDFEKLELPAERITGWPAFETADYQPASGEPWRNTKKIEKMIGLLDMLAGDMTKGSSGKNWYLNNLAFKAVGSPRTLGDLMADETHRYFRARWVRAEGNNHLYSLYGVFHELGFMTGNLTKDTEGLSKLVEIASVLRAMRLYPEFFRDLKGFKFPKGDFSGLPWDKKIALGEKFIREYLSSPAKREELDAVDPEFRERHLITKTDISERVYERIFLSNLRQVYFWKNLIDKGYEEAAGKVGWRPPVELSDGEGIPRLRIYYDFVKRGRGNPERVVTGVGVLSTYQGRVVSEDFRKLTSKAIALEEAPSLEDWRNGEARANYEDAVLERIYYEGHEPALRLRMTAKGIVTALHVYESGPEGARGWHEHAMMAKDVPFDPSWTLERLQRQMGAVEALAQEKDETGEMVSAPKSQADAPHLIIYHTQGKAPEVTGVSQLRRQPTSEEKIFIDVEDEMRLLSRGETYTKSKKGKGGVSAYAEWAEMKDLLFGDIAKRNYVRFDDAREAETKLLTVHLDAQSQHVEKITTFEYDGDGRLISRTDSSVEPGLAWDAEKPMEFWQSAVGERFQTVFYGQEGEERLLVTYPPGSRGAQIASVTAYRGEGKKRQAVVYGSEAVRKLQADWDVSKVGVGDIPVMWNLEEWSTRLSEFEPWIFAQRGAVEAVDPVTAQKLAELAKARQWAIQAASKYEAYERGRRISETWDYAHEVEHFVETYLEPVLALFLGEDVRISQVSERLAQTVILGTLPEVEQILRRSSGWDDADSKAMEEGMAFLDAVPADQVTAEDAALFAESLTGGIAPDQAVPAPAGTLMDLMRRVRKAEEKVLLVEEAYESFISQMQGSLRDFRRGDTRGNLAATLRSHKTVARQAGLWLVPYLTEHYGPRGRVIDADTMATLYDAYRSLGFSDAPDAVRRIPEITDTQPDRILRETIQLDPDRDRWNPDVAAGLSAFASEPAHAHTRDTSTSIMRLQTYPPEQIAEEMAAHNRILETGGVCAVILPVTKVFTEEALDVLESDYGFDLRESGLAYNELADDKVAELLEEAGNNEETVNKILEIIESRQFHVYLFVKRENRAPQTKPEMPAAGAFLANTAVVLDDLGGGASTPQAEANRIHAVSNSDAERALNGVNPSVLTPHELIGIDPAAESERQARRQTTRDTDRKLYRFNEHKLRLIHKYRHFIFDRKAAALERKDKERVLRLLNQTWAGEAKRMDAAIEKPREFWKGKRKDIWNPDPEVLSHAVWDKSGQKGIVVLYSESSSGDRDAVSVKRRVTGIYLVEKDAKGEVLYAEPRKIATTEDAKLYFDPKSAGYDQLASLEGDLYEGKIDFKSQMRFYKEVDQAWEALIKVYPLADSEPYFENVFEGDLWDSLNELMKPKYAGFIWFLEQGQDALLSEETRDFVGMIREVWETLSRPVTPEEFSAVSALCQMVKDIKNQFQLFGGPTYAHGKRRGPMTKEKHWLTEARRHRFFLEGIVSYLSTLSLERRKQYLRNLSEEDFREFVAIDLAAGTGAMNLAAHRLGYPPPGPLYKSRELDISGEYLAEPRPPGYPNTPEADRKRNLKQEPGWAKAHVFLQTEGAVEAMADIYPADYADFLSAAFIVDILTPEQIKNMFIHGNLVLKEGGEFDLTFPQSWRISETFLEALAELGYEVTTPMRGHQTMKDSWRQRIIDSYEDKAYGKEIADAACRMREKPFTILRLRKKKTVNPDAQAVRDMPPTVFDLIKTDTGQRGPSTGERPYRYDPQAMRRWMEILRWVLRDWDPEDVEVFDPFQEKKDEQGSPLLTQTEAIALFPEIESENALKHLYDFRFLFRTEENHYYYETICVFHECWNKSSEFYRRADVELMRDLYRGRTTSGDARSLFDWREVLKRLRMSKDAFSQLAGSGGLGQRNRRLASLAEQLSERLWKASEEMKRAEDPASYLAVPATAYTGEDLSHPVGRVEFPILRRANDEHPELSVQLLAGLLVFGKNFGDAAANNEIFKILRNPGKGYVDKAKPAPPAKPDEGPAGPAQPPAEGPLAPAPEDGGTAPEPPTAPTSQEAPGRLNAAYFIQKSVQRDLFAAVGRAIEKLRVGKEASYSHFPDFEEVLATFSGPGGLDFYPDLAGEGLAPGDPFYVQLERWYRWNKYFFNLQKAFHGYGQMSTFFAQMYQSDHGRIPVPWRPDAGFGTMDSKPTEPLILFDLVRVSEGKIRGLRSFRLGQLPYDFVDPSGENLLGGLASTALALRGLRERSRDAVSDDSWADPNLEIAYLYPSPSMTEQTFAALPDQTGAGVKLLDLAKEISGLTGEGTAHENSLKRLQMTFDFLRRPVAEDELDQRTGRLELFSKILELQRYLGETLFEAQRMQSLDPTGQKRDFYKSQLTFFVQLGDKLVKGTALDLREGITQVDRVIGEIIADVNASRGTYLQTVRLGRLTDRFSLIKAKDGQWGEATWALEKSPVPLTDLDHLAPAIPASAASAAWPVPFPQAASEAEKRANESYVLWLSGERTKFDLWALEDEEKSKIQKLVKRAQSAASEESAAGIRELDAYLSSAATPSRVIARIVYTLPMIYRGIHLDGAADVTKLATIGLLNTYFGKMASENRWTALTKILWHLQILREAIGDASLDVQSRFLLENDSRLLSNQLSRIIATDRLTEFFRDNPKLASATHYIDSATLGQLRDSGEAAGEAEKLFREFLLDAGGRPEARSEIFEKIKASGSVRREVLKRIFERADKAPVTGLAQSKAKELIEAVMREDDPEDVFCYLTIGAIGGEQGRKFFLENFGGVGEALERQLRTVGSGRLDQFLRGGFKSDSFLADFLAKYMAVARPPVFPFPNLGRRLIEGASGTDPVLIFSSLGTLLQLGLKLDATPWKSEVDDMVTEVLTAWVRRSGFRVEDYHAILRSQVLTLPKYRTAFLQIAEREFRSALRPESSDPGRAAKFSGLDRFLTILDHYWDLFRVPAAEREVLLGRTPQDSGNRFERALEQYLFLETGRTIADMRDGGTKLPWEFPTMPAVAEHLTRPANRHIHFWLRDKLSDANSHFANVFRRSYERQRYLHAQALAVQALGKGVFDLAAELERGPDSSEPGKVADDAGFVMRGANEHDRVMVFDRVQFQPNRDGAANKIAYLTVSIPGVT
ncbi:MAG: hypothetical protein WC352_02525, partial [Candidatus Omnitrophota bacterium]